MASVADTTELCRLLLNSKWSGNNPGRRPHVQHASHSPEFYSHFRRVDSILIDWIDFDSMQPSVLVSRKASHRIHFIFFRFHRFHLIFAHNTKVQIVREAFSARTRIHTPNSETINFDENWQSAEACSSAWSYLNIFCTRCLLDESSMKYRTAINYCVEEATRKIDKRKTPNKRKRLKRTSAVTSQPAGDKAEQIYWNWIVLL